MSDSKIKIARIGRPVGIKGLFRLYMFSEDSQCVDWDSGRVYDTNQLTYRIFLVEKRVSFWIAKATGYASRSAVETLVGTQLFVDRDHLPPLAEEEFYHADLCGLEAVDEQGQTIGKIVNVSNFGAGDMLEVMLHANSEVIYHPFTKLHVLKVDIDKKVLVLKKMEFV